MKNHDEIGIVVVGHGSRDKEAIVEFQSLMRLIGESHKGVIESGYLEFERPVVQEAIDRAVARGASSLVVLPAMLTGARHVKDDIPSEIHEAQHRYPDVSIQYGKHLDLHPKILELCKIRFESALSKMGGVNRKEQLLLVVGRGTSDPDANGDVQKVTRLLWEGMGLGWAMTCYAGVTEPLLPEALDHAIRLPYPNILIFPYFLFTGVLVKKVEETAKAYQASNPDRLIQVVPYLGPDPLVRDVFMDRFSDVVHGSANMNCGLCKYRVTLPGFESEVGRPQVGHHHTVRGIGTHSHTE